jgi:hypothetical protein
LKDLISYLNIKKEISRKDEREGGWEKLRAVLADFPDGPVGDLLGNHGGIAAGAVVDLE